MTHTSSNFLKFLHKSNPKKINYSDIHNLLEKKGYLRLMSIDFSGMSTENFFTSRLSKDFDYLACSNFFICNFSDFSFTKSACIDSSSFIECFFDKTLFLDSAYNITFERCFFKDMKFLSRLKECTFKECTFEECSFDDSFLNDCTFTDCTTL